MFRVTCCVQWLGSLTLRGPGTALWAPWDVRVGHTCAPAMRKVVVSQHAPRSSVPWVSSGSDAGHLGAMIPLLLGLFLHKAPASLHGQ